MSLVVFAHGNSFPGNTYRALLDDLRVRGFAVEAIDRLGHDPRFPVTNNWPHLVDQWVEWIAGVAPHHPGPLYLVGHSLGGFVSLMTAARHPVIAGRKVAGVVMLDSPVLGGWRATTLGVMKKTPLVGSLSPGAVSRRRRYQWPDRAAAAAYFSHKRAFAKWDPRVLADYVAHGLVDETAANGEPHCVLHFDRDIETRIYNTLPDNLDKLLRRHPLKCPVVFIGGRQSAEMKQVGMAMTEKLTKGRIMMLDGTHLFPMENPQATAAAIESALLSVRQPAAAAAATAAA